MLIAWSPLTLVIHHYYSLLSVGPLDSIQCLHRADVYKSLLVSQHSYVYVLEFIKEYHL